MSTEQPDRHRSPRRADRPVAEAKARADLAGAVLPRRPAGLQGPRDPVRRRRRRPAAGRRGGRDRPLRARAVHRQRGHHQQPHPDPEPQAAPAAHGRGRRDRREGPDRPRRARQQGRRPGQGLRQLAQGRRGDRHQDPAADREHRRRRQRDGPPPRPDRRGVGRHLRSRAASTGSASAWTPATRGPAASSWRPRWRRSARSPAGSTWCTPTTAATPSTPAPTGTPTSATGSSTRTTSRAWSATPARRSSARHPGGAEEHQADFAWLREHGV